MLLARRVTKKIYYKLIFESYLYSGTWAWDYIYSYLFEYYIGTKDTADGNKEYSISIFQYSDTGFFEKENSTRTNLSTFLNEEESSSKFLFFLEIKPKKSPWWWKIKEVINNKDYASKNHTATILTKGDSTIILYSVPIEKFINEYSALDVLNQFCTFCKENGIIEITLH